MQAWNKLNSSPAPPKQMDHGFYSGFKAVGTTSLQFRTKNVVQERSLSRKGEILLLKAVLLHFLKKEWVQVSKKTYVFPKFCSTDLITYTKRQIPELCLSAGIYGKLSSLLWLPQKQCKVPTV